MNLATDQPPHLLILGGGLAGLAAARECLRSERPCRVTVLEAAGRAGGMARSIRVGGVTCDLGPHRIYSALPEMRRWFEDFLGEELHEVERVSRMYVHGRYLRYPGAPLELLRAFGPVELARFAAGAALARFRPAPPEDEASFASVMQERLGRPLCEALVFPYIRKTWKCEPEEISAATARARATMGGLGRIIRRMLRPEEKPGQETALRRFHYLEQGIERLPRKLVAEIEAAGGDILCNRRATRLEIEAGRVRAVHCEGPDGPERHAADFVFSSIHLPELVEALGPEGDPPGETARRAAATLESLEVVLVFAVVHRPSLGADQWLYFPEADPPINRAFQPKNFHPALAPGDRTLVCIEGTARTGEGAFERPDAELAREYVEALASTGLYRTDEVGETRVLRLRHAYPVFRRGYRHRLEQVWQGLGRLENLIPIGRQGLFQHNNMDHTIFTGLRAAACWAGNEAPVARWYDRELPGFERFRIVD